MLDQVLAEGRKIERALGAQPRHAGAPRLAGDAHAVNDGFQNSRERGHHLGHLEGRYVLALPAKSVADPVDEIEIAALVLLHDVAGAEPGVTLLEHVAQDFLRGGGLLGVSLETAARLGRILEDLADDLASFIGLAGDAEALRIAHRLLALDVELHDDGREAVRQKPRYATDRSGLAGEIEHRNVAFGRRIELKNLREAKPAFERVPHVGTQSVAAGKPQPVLGLERVRWRVHQIPTELA